MVASPLPELETPDGHEEVTYSLSQWENLMRVQLIQALIDAKVPHRLEEAGGGYEVASDLIAPRGALNKTLAEVAHGDLSPAISPIKSAGNFVARCRATKGLVTHCEPGTADTSTTSYNPARNLI